jgi:hypothetical protein
MLDLLLERLKNGDISSIGGLAQDLSVSRSQVELMIWQLEQMGYLKSAGSCGTDPCTGWSKNNACHMDRPVQLWILSDRKSGLHQDK